MKQKIFEKLKQTFSQFGLGDDVMQGLADNIVATTQVTEENMDSIVAGQKNLIELLQKNIDKRVTDAVVKVQAKAKSEAEGIAMENAKKMKELQDKIAELEKNPTPPAPPTPPVETMPDWYKAEQQKREREMTEFKKTLEALNTAKKTSEDELKALKEQKAKEDAQRKAEQRKETIVAKAKEKGIPDWIIKHGFGEITDETDDAGIDKILTEISQEVQTNFLPSKGGVPQFNGKTATKEETDAIVEKLFPAKKTN